MQSTVGVITILVAALAALGVLVRWRHTSGPAPLALLAVLGAAVGAGALLLQDDPGLADWMVTLTVLAVGAPLHVRFMLGPPGPSRMVAVGRHPA